MKRIRKILLVFYGLFIPVFVIFMFLPLSTELHLFIFCGVPIIFLFARSFLDPAEPNATTVSQRMNVKRLSFFRQTRESAMNAIEVGAARATVDGNLPKLFRHIDEALAADLEAGFVLDLLRNAKPLVTTAADHEHFDAFLRRAIEVAQEEQKHYADLPELRR